MLSDMLLETTVRVATRQPCELHKSHTPTNLTTEWHHLTPVGMQLSVPFPANPPAKGLDTSGRGLLWDTRGIWACPTGHRNTHYWLEQLMHHVVSLGKDDLDKAWAMCSAAQRRKPETQQALLGLQRMLPYGSLLGLAKIGEWGQA